MCTLAWVCVYTVVCAVVRVCVCARRCVCVRACVCTVVVCVHTCVRAQVSEYAERNAQLTAELEKSVVETEALRKQARARPWLCLCLRASVFVPVSARVRVCA